MQQSRAGKGSAAGGVYRATSKDTRGRGCAVEPGSRVEPGSSSTSSEVEDRADVASFETLRSKRGLELRFARSRGSEVAGSSGTAERIVDSGAVEASSANIGGGGTE
ncbi:hypothetical protein CRG98_018483 [Punica granatum]|uniref:Uncharacterized protein n=1 Tax=Punica granatum TaxID=22663 RepID=A0A2I0JZC1_PUNGR|nr:hypothetical protein CRG98_018483 [Punica granatum]